MKGLMVTLLALCMTGTVIGQQSQDSSSFNQNSSSNRSTFGNSTPASSAQRSVFENSSDHDHSDHDHSGHDHSADHSSETADQGAVFNLPINARLLNQFMEYGEMTAPLEPYQQQTVDQVVMQFDDGTGRKAPSHNSVPVNIRPRYDAANGTLMFEIDQTDVRKLRTEGLRYTFQPGERGRYKKVVLTLKQNNTAPLRSSPDDDRESNQSFGSPNTSVNSSNRFDSSRRDSNVLQDRKFETDRRDFQTSQNDNRTLPVPGVREYSDDFMGPTMGPGLSPQRNNSFSDNRTNSSTRSNDDFYERQRLADQNRVNQDQYDNNTNRSYDNRFGDALSTSNQNDRFSVTTNDSRSRQGDDYTDPSDYSNHSDLQFGYDKYKQGQDLQTRNDYSSSPTLNRNQFDLTAAEREALQRSRRTQGDDRLASRLDFATDQLRREAEDDKRREYARQLKEERYRDELRSLYDSRRDSLDREDRNRDALASRRSYEDDYVYSGRDYRPVIDHTAVRFPVSPAVNQPPVYDQYRYDQTNYNSPPSRNTLLPAATRVLPQVADNQFGIRSYAAQIPAQRIANANAIQPRAQQPLNGMNMNTAGQLTPQALADKIRTDKINGLMFFMLLCSLALNLYLSWIARGFYVRYNELADELRETFTAIG